MAKRSKPLSPALVAAKALERRRKDFEALGLQPEAATLQRFADVIAEREVRPTPGQRGNEDRVKRLSGLDWLWNKKRISAHQLQAALKYGDDYRRANDLAIKSCMAEQRGGDGSSSVDKRLEAQARLKAAQMIGLSGHRKMQWLCDEVAGEGARITVLSGGDDVEVKKNEAVFTVALDLLAAHYGMITA